MTDGQRLLANILRDPADNTARLVAADWLEENGQHDDAEFIRLSMHPQIRDKRRKPWRRMTVLGELLYPDYDPWYVPMDQEGFSYFPFPGTSKPHLLFDRGFICAYAGTVADWLKDGDGLCAQHPIAEVTITGTVRLEWQDLNTHYHRVIRVLGDDDIALTKWLVVPLPEELRWRPSHFIPDIVCRLLAFQCSNTVRFHHRGASHLPNVRRPAGVWS